MLNCLTIVATFLPLVCATPFKATTFYFIFAVFQAIHRARLAAMLFSINKNADVPMRVYYFIIIFRENS
ncbi:hypothetical protein CNX70_26885 [Janthinobacterium svalbardensis]|uniref:Uncharacterized protein n=1 Tax=Janthinobacterium svalbardensis TaxID=368607 RepID=A0A290X2P2_9BURK|nr:hypothetical protein CNX70_26885 [Janthinobacterium svalbardensis]